MPALGDASMGESPGKLAEPGQAGFINNRGNGMSIPAKALFAADASQIPAGAFYTAGGTWYLSVDANQGNHGGMSAVVLTGQGKGGFVPQSYGTGTYIGGDYFVDIRVDNLEATASADAPWLPALLLGSELTIFARQFGADRLFTLAGMASQGAGVAYDRRRFVRWEGWLCHNDGRTIGEAPLFTVEAE